MCIWLSHWIVDIFHFIKPDIVFMLAYFVLGRRVILFCFAGVVSDVSIQQMSFSVHTEVKKNLLT